MTLAEVIDTLQTWIRNADDEYDREEMGRVAGLKEALHEIKKIEPCEDAISREAVLEIVERVLSKGDALFEIEDLSPVTPQPKTGHWIVDGSVDCYLDRVRCHCSACGNKKEFPADYDHIKQELSISYKYLEFIYNYCPNCGAKMAESEDK